VSRSRRKQIITNVGGNGEKTKIMKKQGRHTLSNPRKIDKPVDARIATRKEFLDKIKDGSIQNHKRQSSQYT
jgi:hypothetical protein